MASAKPHPSLVLDWLSSLEPIPEDPRGDTSSPKKYAPVLETPEKIRPVTAVESELSPTDTNFSFRSVFDQPHQVGEGSEDTQSLCSTSSVGYPVSDCCPSETCHKRLLSRDSVDDLAPESLDSYEPSSEVEESGDPHVDKAVHASTILQVNGEQMIFVVSCLQCTLAGLRCSRTTPTCSRCIRNGVECCLVQRRRKLHEMDRNSFISSDTPILVRLKDDDDSSWRKKEQLAQEVS